LQAIAHQQVSEKAVASVELAAGGAQWHCLREAKDF
jgi:hypothetical protein